MRLWACLFALLIEALGLSARSATGFRPSLRWQRASRASSLVARPGSTRSSAHDDPSSTAKGHAGSYLHTESPEVDLQSPIPPEEVSSHYKRDRRDTHNPLPSDLVGLKNLLRERHHAVRRDRESSKVMKLDAQLRERYGVVVYDSPPVWTTMVDDPPEWLLRKRESRQRREQHERHGPTGHGYRPRGPVDPLFCDLESPDVHRLLARRTRLRADGQFELADAIKFELFVHGIRVLDDALEFHSVGSSTSSRSLLPEYEDQQEFRIQYEYEEDLERSVGWDDDAFPHRYRVEQLVRQRTEALAIGDHLLVSYLDLELFRSYRIRVDDVGRKWYNTSGKETSNKSTDQSLVRAIQDQCKPKEADASHSSAFTVPLVTLSNFRPSEAPPSPAVPSYQLSSTSLGPIRPPHFASRVADRVRERSLKREEGKFHEADALRRELWHTYNVGINDRLSQFSVGGVFDDKIDVGADDAK